MSDVSDLRRFYERMIDEIAATHREQVDQLQAENAKLQDENARLRSCLSDDAENARMIMGENAELRELVRGLWYCTENETKALCEGCPLGVVEGDRLALACEKLMRELAVEVDG